jgi:L-alanine-DL-glutamate epimerase-like enolase superfamily enzyme
MFVTQTEHLAPIARRPAADIVLAEVGSWGGLLQYVNMLHTAAVMGIEIGIHSSLETGIGTALNLHVAAAFPQIRLPMETCLHALEQPLVVGANLEVHDGCMLPPSGPGLGVYLDEAAMSAFTIDQASAGHSRLDATTP